MDGKEAMFLMYRAADGDASVNALIKDETIWLSQKGMAELFDCTADNVSLHLKNIFPLFPTISDDRVLKKSPVYCIINITIF